MSEVQLPVTGDVLCEVRGRAGLVTLNRPQALNALSLGMVRSLTAILRAWREDPAIDLVAIRGTSKDPANPGTGMPFGAFCAGGDIRFFRQAALEGNPQLEDFFTEEYALNHLVHHYPKPYVAFIDGIVMGGGMGIAGHGNPKAVRVATARTKMAMPETNIGLFPDVGGGWFLARCPGRVGEYLALTGQVIGGADALSVALADVVLDASTLRAAWDSLTERGASAIRDLGDARAGGQANAIASQRNAIDRCFGLPDVKAIIAALEADGGEWARDTVAVLRKRSPLMLHVVLEQIRRARSMTFADELRMERDMVRHCFHLRPGAAGETVEGIRALAVDKDHSPRWNPARIEEVTPQMVAPFFESPWPGYAHPLRDLG